MSRSATIKSFQVLGQADQAANSTVFIAFMLEIIEQALMQAATDQATDQVKRLLAVMDAGFFTTQALMTRLGLSHRPTFRKNYLVPALDAGLVEMKYLDKPRSPKQQYRKRVS